MKENNCLNEEFKFNGTYSIPIQDEENIMAWLATENFVRRKESYFVNASKTSAHSKTAPWLHSSNIERFVADFPNGLPDAHSVVLNNTCFRLMALSVTDEVKNSLFRYALGSKESINACSLFGKTKHLRTLCPTCVSNPGGKYHYAVWDRLFNVPGIKVCPAHKQVLLRHCQTCSEKLEFTRPTLFCCERGMELVDELSAVEIEFHAEVSQSARRVLNGALERFSADIIFATLAAKVRNYQADSDDPNNILKDRLVEKIGNDGFTRLGILKKILASISVNDVKNRTRNPVQTLTVIHALFESLDSFIEEAHCISIEYSNPATVTSKRIYRKPKLLEEPTFNTTDELVDITEKYQSIVDVAFEENPAITQTQFVSSPNGKQMHNFLRTHVPDGLSRRFAEKGTKDRNVQESGLAKPKLPRNYETNVAKLVEHIHNRYQFLITSLPEKKITKYALLRDSGKRGIRIFRNAPEVQAALLAYADNREKKTFYLRVVGTLCKRVNEISPGHPYGNEERYQNLTPSYSAHRLHLLRKWLKKQ